MTRTHEPNVTAELLDMVGRLFDEYVIFPSDEDRTAVTVWAVHTWVAHRFESTGRLAVLSREPGSGKSRVLEVLSEITPNATTAVNLKPATMWRLIEHSSPHPTLFVDEADTIFGRVGSSSAHTELRSILNAGYRKGATVPRCVGNQDIKLFKTFAPVALAGLGVLPETIMSRSIVIRMKRAAPNQHVKPFRLRFAAGELGNIKSRLAAWSMAFGPQLELAFPEMPVKDRAADVWEPLFAIADLAGEKWRKAVDRSCRKLTADESRQAPSAGQALLRDIRDIFHVKGAKTLLTRDILAELYVSEGDVNWSESTFGPQAIAKVLREYDVQPVQIRQGSNVGRGYRFADFGDAWSRYVPDTKELEVAV